VPYEIRIEREFCAAHAIRFRGDREPIHGHNWRVKVVIRGESLDVDGLLLDFHDLEQAVDKIITPWHNTHLNEVQPFDQVNPTAELVARELAKGIRSELGINATTSIDVHRVEVSEAPGCVAVYEVE